MTPEAIRIAIQQALVDLSIGLPIAMPNKGFNPTEGQAWQRLTVRMGGSFEGEVGESGVGLRTGVIYVDTFVPTGSGISTANGYAASVETGFRRKNLNGVMTQEPSTDYVGESLGFFQVQTTVDFHAWIGE